MAVGGTKVNPKKFDTSQIPLYVYLLPLAILMGAPIVYIVCHAFKPMDELFVEDKVTDSLTGTKHYHFWSAGKDAVEFTLEQTVTGLKAGTYSFSASIMGGDAGDTDICIYVKRNGETVATAPLQITVYNEWHSASIGDIACSEGDTLIVGIYVKCAGPNAWGKIDDAMLNSVKE